MQDRPKLGEILCRAGVIDAIQLKSALGEQQRWGNRLGMTLVQMGLLDEATLVRTLAAQLEVPMARVKGKNIAGEILELVSAELAEKHRALPLFIKEDAGQQILHVGLEDPTNLEALDEIAFRTGLKIRPVIVSPSELSDAIDAHYGPGSRFGSPGWDDSPVTPSPPEFVEADPPAPQSDASPSGAPSPDAVLRAIAQLLVEKGILSREELIERVRACGGVDDLE